MVQKKPLHTCRVSRGGLKLEIRASDNGSLYCSTAGAPSWRRRISGITFLVYPLGGFFTGCRLNLISTPPNRLSRFFLVFFGGNPLFPNPAAAYRLILKRGPQRRSHTTGDAQEVLPRPLRSRSCTPAPESPARDKNHKAQVDTGPIAVLKS
jgi:hypothetical protein